MPANRTETGQFVKGQSGNPSGRPRDTLGIRALALEHCPKAISRLVELMDHENGSTAEKACRAILERGLGKPHQPLSNEDGDGPVEIVVRYVTGGNA